MKVTTELINVAPLRRVIIELPEDRALALADAIDDEIVWADTEVEDELHSLHNALTCDV